MSNDIKVGDFCVVLPSQNCMLGARRYVGTEVEVIGPETRYGHGAFYVVGFECRCEDGKIAYFNRVVLRKRPPRQDPDGVPRTDYTPAIGDDWSTIGWSPNKSKAPA